MTENRTLQTFRWNILKIADKAEHQKLIHSFHEQEKTLNKNRLLYPPDEIAPAQQFTYIKERRD
jgi:hypothetical protein